MGYMGTYYNIPQAIFYLHKGDSRVRGVGPLAFQTPTRVGARQVVLGRPLDT